MFIRLPFIRHYFHQRLKPELTELFASVTIQDLALAMVVLFEPVYLYRLGYSLQHILVYYLVVYGVYYFLVPLGAKFIAYFGPPRAIAVSTVFLIAYYASLLSVASTPVFFWIAPIMLAIQKMFYWPAYHADFVINSDQNDCGKEFSGLWSLSTLVYVIGPAIGGFIIQQAGFNVLLCLVIALIVLSNIPLFIAPLNFRTSISSYWAMFCQPFSRLHLRTTLSYFSLGEELIQLVIWPVFIALSFKTYEKMGGVIAVATLISVIATLYIGKLVDRQQTRRTLRLGAIITAINWLVRPWMQLVGWVFTSETVGRIAKDATFVCLTTASYGKALREKQIIERVVLFEQGFALGKFFIAALIIVLAQWLAPFTAAFLAAAGVSLLYLLFSTP